MQQASGRALAFRFALLVRVPVLFLAPGFGLTRNKNMSFTGRRVLSLHGLRAFDSLVHFASRNFSRRAAALAFAALACLTMFRLRGPCVEGQMEGLRRISEAWTCAPA